MKYLNLTKMLSLTVAERNLSFEQKKIISSKNSADYFRGFFDDDIELFESFFIILLNRSNDSIGFSKISQGGTCGTVVDVKLIAKYCIDTLAQGVVLCHNHPSGNTNPSNEDKNITQKIKEALKLIDCTVLDHIILTKDNYYSFADEYEL